MNIIHIAHQLFMIALAIIGLGFLIGFHELGHFLMCKLFNIGTPSFSLGFGPRIFKKRIGDTDFVLSAIPLGGYVEIAGAEELGQGEQKEAHSKDASSFAVKPFYQKALVMLGGILFNMAFAYIALAIVLMIGSPKTPLLFPYNATPTIQEITPDSPASQALLQPQDIIVSANGTPITANNMAILSQLLLENSGKTVALTIKRGDAQLETLVTLNELSKKKPILGASFITELAPRSLPNALHESAAIIHQWISSVTKALSSMIKKGSTQGLGGPIAIISETIKNAQYGIQAFILILCFISVNLAFINLIPLPIFDGGQILFYGIEALIGRSFDLLRYYTHLISWLFVIVLTLYLIFKDILTLCK